jgi:hypothetical protein
MKSIGAILGVGLAGVFVGALITEVIHRVDPDMIKNLGTKTKKTLGMVGQAFKEGYYQDPAAKK